MLVYSRSIKIRASGFSELLESIFCILLVMEAFSLQTVVKILQVVVGWQEVRWMWWMRHNFVANSSNLWKAGCEVVPWGGGVENGPLCSPVLAASAAVFSASDLLSALLRCNASARIQKAAVRLAADHQTVTKDLFFFWCKFGFGKYFGAASWSSHWAGHHWLLYKIHCSSHITIWSINGSLLLCRIKGDTSKWQFFFICNEASTYQAFSPFQFASNAEWL